MYNPFPILTKGLLEDQIIKGKRYYVRQTFPRGHEGRLQAAFLVRGYPEEEKEIAEQHTAAIIHDRHAFLYDAQLPEHFERLKKAASKPFGYKIFYAAKKGIDWDPPMIYQIKIKAYIRLHHPTWRTQKDGEKITIGLHEEFGELFLTFSFDKESDKIPFDLIEQY